MGGVFGHLSFFIQYLKALLIKVCTVLAYCNKVKDTFLTDTILLCTDLLLLKSCLVEEPFILCIDVEM